MSIALVWYWDRASEIMPYWRDGLRAAVDILCQKYSVSYYLDKKVPEPGKHDVILVWGDAQSPFLAQRQQYANEKIGVFLSAMPVSYDLLKSVSVVYCESQPIYEAVRAQGIHALLAFGTDSSFYNPDDSEKDIEYFYPATFSPWKKQSSIAHIGKELLCIGTVQPDGEGELQACRDGGVQVEIGYFPAEKIRNYYRRAKRVIVPAIHGSERTVLESMSMNIVPDVIEKEINNKAYSYIQEYKLSEYLFPRDFILRRYSAKQYVEQIVKGIL